MFCNTHVKNTIQHPVSWGDVPTHCLFKCRRLAKVPLSYSVKISFQFYLLLHLWFNNCSSEALSPGSESKGCLPRSPLSLWLPKVPTQSLQQVKLMLIVRPPNTKLSWSPSRPPQEMFSRKKSFFHCFITISPFCFPFGSGVQRHHKVL